METIELCEHKLKELNVINFFFIFFVYSHQSRQQSLALCAIKSIRNYLSYISYNSENRSAVSSIVEFCIAKVFASLTCLSAAEIICSSDQTSIAKNCKRLPLFLILHKAVDLQGCLSFVVLALHLLAHLARNQAWGTNCVNCQLRAAVAVAVAWGRGTGRCATKYGMKHATQFEPTLRFTVG